jgi:hypothetical protein
VVFVQIHTNEFIQLLYKLYSTNLYTVWFSYEFIQFLYELYYDSYKVWFFTFYSKSAQAARGKARAHLLPRPGRTRLPRPLGYTRLPRPVRVRSWGSWVRNGIKVYNLYYRLPRLLGYTRLPAPRPLGYTRLPQYTNLYSTIRIIIRPSEKQDCTNSFVCHMVVSRLGRKHSLHVGWRNHWILKNYWPNPLIWPNLLGLCLFPFYT